MFKATNLSDPRARRWPALAGLRNLQSRVLTAPALAAILTPSHGRIRVASSIAKRNKNVAIKYGSFRFVPDSEACRVHFRAADRRSQA
jgi:hypothetical protein